MLHSVNQPRQCACIESSSVPQRPTIPTNSIQNQAHRARQYSGAFTNTNGGINSRLAQHVAQASSGQQGGCSSIPPAEYTAPFSAVDPAVRSDITDSPDVEPSSATPGNGQQQEADPSADKWGEVLAVNHTLSSLYLRKVKARPCLAFTSQFSHVLRFHMNCAIACGR